MHDEISTWTFNFYDVDDLVVPGDFVRESDFTQLAVHFLEFDYYVFAVHFARTF